MDPWKKAKEDVQKAVEDALAKMKVKKSVLKEINIEHTIEEPPSYKMGDLACSISFPIGKGMKVSPRKVAEEIIAKIRKPKSVYLVKLAGAYVNFFLKFGDYSKDVIIAAEKDDYGGGEKKKEKVMVEYSQPNPHKAFHIGHIRGTVLGESLSRILKHDGYEVVQVNLFNDIGAHVAKCMWAYTKFHKDEKPPFNKGAWLGRIYTEACQKIAENPEYESEVSEVLQKLESGEDEKLIELWKETRQWSMDEFKRIYEELGAHFDHDFYESELKEHGREIVMDMLKKKLAKKSRGAVIIDLKKEKLPPWLLLKSDGTALYSTQDLALAEEKFKKFNVDISLYVVGSEQRLHFQQLFKTLEIMGFKQAKKCFHLAFDLVNVRGGKMSSREGTAILYTELSDKMKRKAMSEVIERNPEMDPNDQREIASQIAIGAMKFGMLNISNTKTIFFDWDKALEFEGETGPYVQYAAVRAKRILEKAGKLPQASKVKFELLDSKDEQRVIKQISKFPSVVEEAAREYKPHLMANYVYALADKFSSFYTENPVIDAESKELRNARLMLVNATYKTLEKALELLGIEVPERM